MHGKLRCLNVRIILRCLLVEGFRMCVLGQTRHDKSRSVRRVEGFGACFWVKRRTKSRDACGKMKVLDCFGMCVLVQMRHEKSKSVR